MGTVNLTNKTFDNEISEGVTLVDFWATWCPPCRVQGPILEDLSKSIDKDVTIAKVDVDQEKEIALKYMIRSIPTLIIFKDGKPVDTMVGVQSHEVLTNKLSKYFK
ncbi:TPA: thioredoxin [Listeria monocytogenes]